MIKYPAKYVVTFLLSLFAILPLQAQYIDEFAAAGDVAVSDNGYGVGLFSSPSFPLALATLDQNEYFHQDLIQVGLIEKTLWFKFTIATRRNVTISLKQRDTLIAQQDLGFAVFFNPAGMAGPHNLAHEFPVMNKQGNTGYDCLEPGEYYVQVCSRQRAMDSVWIEVEVEKPVDPLSDWNNPPKIIMNSYDQAQLYLYNFKCSYMFSDELRKLSYMSGDIRQTSFQFNVDSGFDSYSIIIDYQDNWWRPVQIVLLKEDSTLPLSQWQIIDSLTVHYNYRPEDITFHYGCINNNDLLPGKYRMVFFYGNNKLNRINIEVIRKKDMGIVHNIPMNLPAQYQMLKWGNIPDAKFSCNSQIPKQICPDLNKDLFRIEYQWDTTFFDKQGWFTVHMKKNDPVSIDLSTISFDFNLASADEPEIWLYKGDIQQGCQLTKIERGPGGLYCVDSGVYSLRILYAKEVNYLSSWIYIKTYSHPFAPVTHQFNDSLVPDNLGSLMDVLPNQLGSNGAYFDHVEQHLLAGNQMVKGSMMYHEFYVSATSPFSILIELPNMYMSPSVRGYLFKGRKSKSSGGDFVQEFTFKKDFYCGLQDTGWYTLVVVYGPYTSNCGYINNKKHSVIFNPTQACPNQAPTGTQLIPYKINNGNPLTTDFTTVQGTYLAAPKRYYLPEICMQCANQNPDYAQWLAANCSIKLYDDIAFYFAEFELDVASQFLSANHNSKFYMIRGSLKQNQALLTDKSNYLDPCDNSGSYCNLSPGTYTLVYTGWIGKKFTPFLVITPMVVYPNNFLESFIDLGTIQGNVNVIPYTSSCAITIDSSDYLANKSTIPKNVHLGPPLPDSKHANSGKSTLWYYLELDGLGELKIDYDGYATLYEIPDSLPVSLLKYNPAMRMKYAGSMRMVAHVSSHSTYFLKKGSCDKKGYFMVLDGTNIAGIVEPFLSWTSYNPPTQKSDFCNTAKLLDVTQLGVSSGKLDVRCLTIGEGFGEDGNNMACLPLDYYLKPYVSAWYKIHIDPGTRYDVDFSVKPLPGASIGYKDVKYRILYGSCSALTPGPCVESLNAKFGFECMDAGDFYLQIIIPENGAGYAQLQEQLQISVDVRATSTPICRPFDPDRPLASFNFDGHCEMDSVRFLNYSSQGSDIAYLWDFGDGRTSTLKDPVIWFQTTAAYKDFRVKLMVTNTVKQKSDSIERVVRIRNAPLRIDVPFTDSLIRCGSFISIVATPNFSDGTLFNLNPVRGDTALGDRVEEYYNSTYPYVRFIAYASNCVVDTFVKVRIHQKLGILPNDSLLCTDQPIALDLSPYQQVTWYPKILKSPKIVLSDTGTYWVSVHDSGCYLRDTIRLHDRRSVFNHALDTFLCSADSAQIMTLPQYTNWHWDNGQTTRSRWVYESGNYWVEGQWETCLNRDTVRVNFVEVNDPLKQDADSFCREGSLELRSDIEAQTYIWNTRQSTRSITVNTTGTYYLNVYTAHCHASDSIRVLHYPADIRLGEDTGFCKEISLRLDAGSGSAYTWWPVSSTNRYFTVNDSGTYGVEKINQYGCIDADTIHVFENCGPYLLLPTAFTPNGDGVNDILSWSHVDVSEFEIHIYNRWGEEVFMTTDVTQNWDGSYKGEIAGEGLYIYRIVYGGEDFTGRYHRRNMKGTVLLIR